MTIKAAANPEAEALEKEMTGTGDNPVTPAGNEPEAKPAADPAVKGKETAKPDDDPEIDLGAEGKVKRSQVLGWRKSGMLEEDYRKKTEDLSAKEKELASLAEMSDFLAKNPKKLQKVLSILQEADEAAAAAADGTGTKAAAKEAKDDAKDAIAKVLEQLDPEDPVGALLKAMYTTLTDLNKKVGGFEQREQELRSSEQQRVKNDQVSYAQGVLKKTIGDVEKDAGLDTDEEKAAWKNMVLSHLKDNPKNYTSEEDFVKAVKDAGAKASKQIKAMAEATLKKYLEGKTGPTLPGPGAGGDAAPRKKEMSFDNLQSVLETALEEQAAQPK